MNDFCFNKECGWQDGVKECKHPYGPRGPGDSYKIIEVSIHE